MKKILYVEDDPFAQDIIKRVLKNFDVDTCFDAEVALRLSHANTYDLFLIDINLTHGIDGMHLLQHIRKLEKYKSIPAIAVTAYATESDRREFLSKGFNDHLPKPFPLDVLREKVNTLLV